MERLRVVLTGGAGHIGRHICAGLAEAGADVLSISSKPGDFPTSMYVGSHVCEIGDETVLDQLLFEFGPITGLVNCAGRSPRHADMNMGGAEYIAGLQAGAGMAFLCAKVAARHMPEGGSFVTLASMWGAVAPSIETYLGMKNDPSFAGSGSAGAIMAMVRHMAALLGPKNIRCNALVPGWFPKRNGPDNPEYMAAITSRIPMGRIGKPEELVGPALFLLSKASSYMTGQCLVIDGGYSIR